MTADAPNRRFAFRRIAELFGFALVLFAAFVAGGWVNPFSEEPRLRWPSPRPAPPLPPDVANGIPKPGARPPEDPRAPEPRAVRERAAVIRRDADAIRAECERAAGGDWAKWQRDTAPYRAALKAKIDALKPIPGHEEGTAEGRDEPLEGLADFPLFEVWAKMHLNYLHDPATLAEFRHDRPVVAANRWLRDRGIDLIFVPVPKMTEVYVDRMLAPCPPDGIIAPHVRQTLLELLQADVEVVDGLRLFRARRDADAEYLYNTADSHWAPRAMRIMAKEIADRIERYNFGTRARFGLPTVQAKPGPYLAPYENRGPLEFMNGWTALSPEQKERAKAVQTTNLAEVSLVTGELTSSDQKSPVLLIGHSYADHFTEQLVRELNLQIHQRVNAGGTTSFFAEFLREPAILDHCRVVVWLTTEQHMTIFQPMADPVMETILPADQKGKRWRTR